MSFLFAACSEATEKKLVPQIYSPSSHYKKCNSADSLHTLTQGDTVIASGIIQPFTPEASGKGAGVKFFEYELLLADSSRIILVADSASGKEPSFQPSEKYTVTGVYQILPLHNKPCPPYCQNAAVPQLKLVDVFEVEN